MKIALLAVLTLLAATASAAAQQCIYRHCSHSLRMACDWRCCDLPYSCVRAGPIRPVPPHMRWPGGPPPGSYTPGPHGRGGIPIK